MSYNFGGDPASIDEAQLKQEIVNSSMTKICHNVGIEGDLIKILFDGRLSAGEKVTLDGLINNHTPAAKPLTSYGVINPVTHLLQHQIGDMMRTFMSLQPNEIYISKSGQAQYTSIKAAVQANSGINTIYNIYPGDYTEDNPIVLPRGSSMRGTGTPDNVRIIANDPNADIISFGRASLLANLTLTGARGAKGLTFDCSQSSGGGEFGMLIMVYILDCNIGLEADGKNMSLSWVPDALYAEKVVIKTISQAGSRAVSIVNGGVAILSVVRITGVQPSSTAPTGIPFAYGVYCTGTRSRVTMVTGGIWFCQVGCFINDGGNAQLNITQFNYNAIGFQVGTIGTSCVFTGTGIDFTGNVLYNLDILAADAKIDFGAGLFDDKLIHNPNGVSLNLKYNVTKFGRFFQSHLGDFQFGSVVAPSKVAFGEGQYAVDGVYVFTNTHLEDGVWTDVTHGSQTIEAPAFNIFAGTTTGNCIYIGSDSVTPGFKIDVIVATAQDVKTSDIAWEYWDGSAWTALASMQTYASKPCYSTLTSFIHIQGKFHVRFGIKSSLVMPLKTINGRAKKWIRGRLLKDIDLSPQGEYLKLHTNSQIINADGFSEFFGDSRLVKHSLPLLETAYSSDDSPLDQQVFITKDININLQRNLFKAGLKAKQSMRGIIPDNVDTSFPLSVRVSFVGSSSNSGNVHWKFKYIVTVEGDPIYFTADDAPGTDTKTIEDDLTVTVEQANQDARMSLDLDIQQVDINPGNGKSHIIWMSLERDSSGADNLDTYDGDIAVILFKCSYVTWNNGSHLLAFQ